MSTSLPDPDHDLPSVQIIQATEEHTPLLRALFTEYADSLPFSLAFQNFDEELETLPGSYAPPLGVILLAWVDAHAAGCCALRPFFEADYPNACEMKRLYVRPAFRGFGVGRMLVEEGMNAAKLAGYSCILLDTLDGMEAARALYEDFNFQQIAPYYHNPIGGARYLKADI